eukprot:g18835.t1
MADSPHRRPGPQTEPAAGDAEAVQGANYNRWSDVAARNWWLGVVYILIVAVIWTAASVLKQFIFHQMDFDHPLFVTVFCNACYIVQFGSVFVAQHRLRGAEGRLGRSATGNSLRTNLAHPFLEVGAARISNPCSPSRGAVDGAGTIDEESLCAEVVGDGRSRTDGTSSCKAAARGSAAAPPENVESEVISTTTGGSSSRMCPAFADDVVEHEDQLSHPPVDRMFDRYHMVVAAAVTPVWFLAQYTYAEGLDKTSVTSSTVISTTSCVPTFLLSLLLLGEESNRWKWVGVSACVVGNLIVALAPRFLRRREDEPSAADSEQKVDVGERRSSTEKAATTTFAGDLLCLLSTLFYASYCLLVKRYVRQPLWFFAYLGLYMTAFGFPLVYWLTPAVFGELDGTLLGLLLLNGIGDI